MKHNFFWRICLEIVDTTSRCSPVFPFGTERKKIALPFAFHSLISQQQLREIESQIVSSISFVWLADLEKPLSLFIGRPNRFVRTNAKHPHFPFDFQPKFPDFLGKW